MSVVVAYAVTEESEAALTHGVREAVRRQVPLHVLVTSAEAEAAAQKQLHSAGKELSEWVLHEVPVQQSPAHAVLDVAAEVGAELVVVGARRRSPVGKLLLGSLAQQILLGADAPVLLVKP